MPSTISCAERQQSWRSRNVTTARLAPPRRKPAERRPSSASSLQLVIVQTIPILIGLVRSASVKSRMVLLCVLSGVVVAGGCGGGARTHDRVVAAFYPLAFAAEQVAGG